MEQFRAKSGVNLLGGGEGSLYGGRAGLKVTREGKITSTLILKLRMFTDIPHTPFSKKKINK